MPIFLNGTPLPYVKQLLHLGNTIESDNSMKADFSIKRAKFIGKVNSLDQEFYFASPVVRGKLINLYCCTYYSSSIWNQYGRDCDKLYKSFNVAIRMCNKVPRNSHRYIIEELIDFPHPKTMLCSRFIKFYNTLINSKKDSVRILAKLCSIDESTVLRSNLRNIARDCHVTSVNELTHAVVKSNMKYHDVPENEEWRVPLLHNLLSVRSKDWILDDFDDQELETIIAYVCAS